MISLYIHIPFCASKCAYCSFTSFPIGELIDAQVQIANYVEALKKEIDHYAQILTDKHIKTLYFGGGTPSRIGVERIIDIIEYIRIKFDLEDLAELSIELNPYPEEEVLNFVHVLNKKYNKISRLRYSFGIQSFDDEVLKIVGRAYSFSGIVEFLRSLTKLKQENNVFNFDFIAFGKFQVSKNGHTQLRHEFKRDFLQKFLASGYADSLSLYTLEGLSNPTPPPPSPLHGEGKSPLLESIPQMSAGEWRGAGGEVTCPQKYFGTDEEIMEEFLILKTYIEDAGLMRYEISNFAAAGKASIHNMVYRNMENYLGLGLSASSFFNQQGLLSNDKIYLSFHRSIVPSFGLRWTNTRDIKQYIEGHRTDEKEIQILNKSDLLIEEFFLRLRTREGIADINKFNSILITNYELRITNLKKEGLVEFDGSKLRLTDEGMSVYNSIVTELLERL